MDEIERKRQERKFKRFRTLGTNNPFCRICGKSKWWVRFEDHHIGGRDSNLLVLLCLDCHNEAHEMEKDLPPLPPHVDPARASLIRKLQGLGVLLRMIDKQNDETIIWLLGELNLPSVPIALGRDQQVDLGEHKAGAIDEL